MGPVTVVASGGPNKPQPGNLAVKGIKVGCGHRLVALAALVDNPELEPFLVGSGDGVGRMAVVANWPHLLGAGRPRGVNALREFFVDAAVALAAGSGDMFAIDGGTSVAGRQFVMGGVAGNAGGRDQKPTFQKPLAVNAFDVIFYHQLLLASQTDRRFLPFSVALPAQVRDMKGIR